MFHGLAQQVPLRPRPRGRVVDVGLGEHTMKDGVLVAQTRNERAPRHRLSVDLLRHDFKAPRLLSRCSVGVFHLELASREHTALEDNGHLLACDQTLHEVERLGDRRVGEVVEVTFLVRRDHLGHRSDAARIDVRQIHAVLGLRRKGAVGTLQGKALFVCAIAACLSGIVARFALKTRAVKAYGGIYGQMQRARAVLRAVDVTFAPLHVENLGRHAVFTVRSRHPRHKAVALAVGERQGVGAVVFHGTERDAFSHDLVFRVELFRHQREGIAAKGVVVVHHTLGALDTFAHRPPRIAAVEVVDEHLQVFFRSRGQRETQTAVDRVAEFPDRHFPLLTFEFEGVVEMPRVLHLERLGVHQRVALAVVFAIRADGNFDVLCEGEVERERIVAHDRAVAIGVVVGHHVEKRFARGGIDYHNSSYEYLELPA